jgi:putative ABC transport system permease protein
MPNIITPDYFNTLGAHLLSGRDFGPSDDAGAPRVMIISEIFATRYWGKRSPIGACLRGAGDPDSIPCAQVIGVVQNIRRQSIYEDSTNFFYLPMAQAGTYVDARELVARVDDGNPSRVIADVRRAMQTAAPNLPFADVHLFADEPTVRQELRPFRLGATMFAVFGALALVLAAIGIYGVVSYDTTQRTKEMGVRIALGARSRSVAGLVLREGVGVAVAGVCVGTVVVLAGAKFVTPLLYETSARDPLILTVVALLLVGVAATACLLPARRAVRVDPIVALREE